MSFVDYLRPSAGGSDGKAVRLPVFTLMIGVILSAVLLTYLLFFAGRIVTGWAPETWRIWAGVVWLAICIGLNGGFWRERVPMWKRQTPQQVFYNFPQPVASFIWGFDVGFMITTYRVTMATWALWGLLLLGIAPPGITGLGYALGFSLPAAALVLGGHRSGRTPMTGSARLGKAPTMHKIALFVLAASMIAAVPLALRGA